MAECRGLWDNTLMNRGNTIQRIGLVWVSATSLVSRAAGQCDEWQPLNNTPGGWINCVVEYNKELVVGGYYTPVDDPPIVAGDETYYGHISRLERTGWRTLGGGMDGHVRCLAIYGEDLIAGGRFHTAGGVSADHIARWDGQSWHPLGSGVGPNQQEVNALAVYNNELIAGGDFWIAGGQPANKIARWNGSEWLPLGAGIHPGNGFWAEVHALTVFDGELIVAGSFLRAGDVLANKVARWNGSTWQPLGDLGGSWRTPNGVFALSAFNGDLIVGGTFSIGTGNWIENIARWDGNSNWLPLGGGIGLAPPFVPKVMAMMPYDDALIVSGSFDDAGGQAVQNLAVWDGSLWRSFGMGVDGRITDYTMFNEELIAVGDFFSVGGIPAHEIVSWCGPIGYLPCPADLTGDAHVTMDDLLLIVQDWGACAPPTDCLADLDQDGTVGVPDLLIGIYAWGSCP